MESLALLGRPVQSDHLGRQESQDDQELPGLQAKVGCQGNRDPKEVMDSQENGDKLEVKVNRAHGGHKVNRVNQVWHFLAHFCRCKSV